MSFKEGDRVVFVPECAKGDVTHKDCKRGVVGSVSPHYVFVRYWNASLEKYAEIGIGTEYKRLVSDGDDPEPDRAA